MAKNKDNRRQEISAIAAEFLRSLLKAYSDVVQLVANEHKDLSLLDVKINTSQKKTLGKDIPLATRLDEFITVTEAAQLAMVSKGLISRWASRNLVASNGHSGHKRRVLKSHVLLVARWQAEKSLHADLRQKDQEAKRIPNKH